MSAQWTSQVPSVSSQRPHADQNDAFSLSDVAASVTRRIGHAAAVPYHLLLEARIPIVVVFGMRIVVASDATTRPSLARISLVVAWLALTVSAYVFNGITDLAADRVNGSNRPLATGRLSASTAAIASVVLAALGLADCWWIGPPVGLAGTLSLALGWAYSAGPQFKRSPLACGITVAAAATLTYYAGAEVGGDSAGVCVAYLLWSAWIGLASPAKDLSDIDGDRLDGRRSLPVVLGPVAASQWIAAVSLVWSVVLVVTIRLAAAQLGPVAWIALAGTIAFAIRLVAVRPGQSRKVLRRPYRALMLTQFAVNAALFACTV